MSVRRWRWRVLLGLVLAGCAGPAGGLRTTWDIGGMCKHCNCVMPAGIDPGAMCPVCDCGFISLHCLRGT